MQRLWLACSLFPLYLTACWADFPASRLERDQRAQNLDAPKYSDHWQRRDVSVPDQWMTTDLDLPDGAADARVDGDFRSSDHAAADRSLTDGSPRTERGARDGAPLLDGPKPVDAPPCGGLACPLGCNVKLGRCNRLEPSNFSARKFFGLGQGVLTATVAGAMIFDTDTGAISVGATIIRKATASGVVDGGIYYEVVAQGGGAPGLAVFSMKSFSVDALAQAVVRGNRALAIYTVDSIRIAGVLTAPAAGRGAGSGGFIGGTAGSDGDHCAAGGEGKAGARQGTSVASGGGGGGRAFVGGAGGGVVGLPAVAGGAGGQANGASALVPLYGGCGGGGGGGTTGGIGGGGGGAIQLATNGDLTVSGVITVPGAGGSGSQGGTGGGGGGSGGAVLLEGASITVSGMIAANGGGGGGGGVTTQNGIDGQPATTAASGGPAGVSGSAGGAGGAFAIGAGQPGLPHATDAGGGGGAAGRIQLNSPSVKVGALNASPTPTQGTTLVVW